MMLTAVSYILLQGPAQYFEAQKENTDEVRVKDQGGHDVSCSIFMRLCLYINGVLGVCLSSVFILLNLFTLL